MIDAKEWPRVPDLQRPKPLFVAQVLEEEEETALVEKGWAVEDLRLWPNTSTSERQRLVLAWLEGLRVGSIAPTPRIYNTLELEAKTCGLTTAKEIQEKPKSLDEETIDTILDLQSPRAGRRLKI